jgi:hypothetical protein
MLLGLALARKSIRLFIALWPMSANCFTSVAKFWLIVFWRRLKPAPGDRSIPRCNIHKAKPFLAPRRHFP